MKSAIVLCAGRGSRLKPHTNTIPKPLLPVNGKPTLDLILAALANAGIENIVLVTNYLSEQIEAYASGQRFFMQGNIACVRQMELAGTADATAAALQAKPDWFERGFILTASDYLVPPNYYSDLVTAYTNSGKAIAVSLKRVAQSEQAMRSSVRFDTNGDVLEVVEKPPAGTAPSDMSANLIFILPANIVDHITSVKPSPRGEKEIQSAVNSYLAANGVGCGLEQETPSEWQPDMG